MIVYGREYKAGSLTYVGTYIIYGVWRRPEIAGIENKETPEIVRKRDITQQVW